MQEHRMDDRSDPSPHDADAHLVFANQWSWVRRIGRIDTHGAPRPILERDDMLVVRTGATGAAMIGSSTPPDETALETAMHWLRCTHSENVLVWSVGSDPTTDAWLLAHGAQEHFTPRWMQRPNTATPACIPSGPAAIRQARPEDLRTISAAKDLPYVSAWEARSTVQLATRDQPHHVKMLVATIGAHVVGRALINLAEVNGIRTAGIYNVGVLPDWQQHGIGRQLMGHAISLAHQCDADRLTLNTTPAGEPLYRSLGFEDVGTGQCWLVSTHMLRYPPTADHAEFALRIAWGEPLTDYERFSHQLLPNRETPLAMAARFEQVDIAEDLLDMGTVPDIAALWSLGLHDEAIMMMRSHTDAINARYGSRQITPLHTAIYWDDIAFLRTLLDHGADPSIRDGQFHSDAWGWCHALGNQEALALLEDREVEPGPAHSSRSHVRGN